MPPPMVGSSVVHSPSAPMVTFLTSPPAVSAAPSPDGAALSEPCDALSPPVALLSESSLLEQPARTEKAIASASRRAHTLFVFFMLLPPFFYFFLQCTQGLHDFPQPPAGAPVDLLEQTVL